MKHDLRVAAYGTVDETNASIGICRLHLEGAPGPLDECLARIQNDLFDLGADLAVPASGSEADHNRLQITATQVSRLESEIDSLNSELEPLRSFILPGGTELAAHLHMARTVCRRAERLMVELASMAEEPVNDNALRYMNRLSDLLFVAARAANENGARDVLWEPGKTSG